MDDVTKLILEEVRDLKKILQKHMAGGCGTQRELTEHKSNHKWIIVTTIGIFTLIVAILNLWG